MQNPTKVIVLTPLPLPSMPSQSLRMTHFDNLETRFSFRTRILDYLWADLPMIVTEGDSMADLVKEHDLGQVVRYENVDDIANSITLVLEKEKEYRDNIARFKKNFFWKNVVLDLIDVIENDKYSITKRSSCSLAWLSFQFYFSGIRKKLFK